ncbi:hypothetical protein [Gilvibacter sp.]|uniref:hypothetical protein n=1 Tax=Gilvibacter sp. TaxID=2729997 RepID=UPI0025BCD8BA|nr:hypothetical protein [Gilvibacter sp.]NQX77036.1 hypothetical protein [Gilvibacter sp.]
MSSPIRVGSYQYQKVFEDDDVIITAKLYWKNNLKDVSRGHFRLVNKNFAGDKYKIHNALFCNAHRMLELRLSSHSNFGASNDIFNQDLDGMQLGIGDQQAFWFRVSVQSQTCTRPECQTPDIGGSPDDKEGSILIGTQ